MGPNGAKMLIIDNFSKVVPYILEVLAYTYWNFYIERIGVGQSCCLLLIKGYRVGRHYAILWPAKPMSSTANDVIDRKTDVIDRKTDVIDRKTDDVIDRKTDVIDRKTDVIDRKPMSSTAKPMSSTAKPMSSTAKLKSSTAKLKSSTAKLKSSTAKLKSSAAKSLLVISDVCYYMVQMIYAIWLVVSMSRDIYFISNKKLAIYFIFIK